MSEYIQKKVSVNEADKEKLNKNVDIQKHVIDKKDKDKSKDNNDYLGNK